MGAYFSINLGAGYIRRTGIWLRNFKSCKRKNMRILLLTIVVLFLSACTSEEFDKASTEKFDKISTLAEQGDAKAQFNLGLMYSKGQGVTQDSKQAVKWYRKAAEQGDVDAQYNLGLMYASGKGVTQDYVLAHMWWDIAASSGYESAVKNRDRVAEEMSPSQIEKAHEMAREWTAKH